MVFNGALWRCIYFYFYHMPVFISKLLSLFFHPIFMPLYALFLVFNSEGIINLYYSGGLANGGGDLRLRIYLVFFVITVVMPLISFMIMKRNGMVSSFAMPKREERFFPYASTLIYYGILYYLLRSSNFPSFFLTAVLGTIVVMIVIILCNLKFKISAHTAGIAGVVGIYAAMIKNNWIQSGEEMVMYLCILTGLIGTVRLSLSAHRPLEIYAGAMVGFAGEFLVMNYKWVI